MNTYITGNAIRALREKRGLSQLSLAERIGVTDKAVSKWETGRGYPDITLLEPLSAALGVTVLELLSGSDVTNQNRSGNMLKSRFYVCPVCGNVIFAAGDAVICCCGLTLPALEAEPCDDAHRIELEPVEDEVFVHMDHDMTKRHYISFFALLTTGGMELVKLYPEGNAEARFKRRGHGWLYACCNQHGLFKRRF